MGPDARSGLGSLSPSGKASTAVQSSVLKQVGGLWMKVAQHTALGRGRLDGWNAVAPSSRGRARFSKRPSKGHGGLPPASGFSEGQDFKIFIL
jgi:hypothetical protein